ncbi:MAG: amidohydrolase family protein [Acidobacteriota bacterium]
MFDRSLPQSLFNLRRSPSLMLGLALLLLAVGWGFPAAAEAHEPGSRNRVAVHEPAIQGQGEEAEEEETVQVIRTGTLIVDPSRQPIEGGVVVVRGSEIVAAGPAGSVEIPDGAEEIDLSQMTVLPGLIDSHSHLDTGGFFSSQRPSLPLSALRASRGMKRAVEVGVTTLRVVGSFGFVDVALRDAINEETILGPRVIPAGHALSIPGGHGDFLSYPADFPIDGMYTPLRGFISSPAEAERAVQLQIKYGAEVIKVAASGGVGSPLDEPTQEQVSPDELMAIADMAHRMGRRATAHAENAGSIKAAVRAGFDSIDHASELDDEAIQLMQEHGTFYIPTLFIVVNINERGQELGMPAYVLQKAKELARKHFPSFEKAHQAGVKIAAGSDMSYGSPGGTLIDELKSEVDYGMTPREALVTATINGAANVGLEGEIGSLEAGKQADLIAVAGDPLSDITTLDQIALVMRAGHVLVSKVEGVAGSAGR